jgi:hypothetical protein
VDYWSIASKAIGVTYAERVKYMQCIHIFFLLLTGQVAGIEEDGQHYLIRWSDGSQTRQTPLHIFSAATRKHRLVVGDRVLAISDPQQVIFLPGQIIADQDMGLVVRFCDGQV